MAAKKTVSRFAEPMSDLHKLLTQAFPEHRTATHEVLDITWLAKKLKMSREGFYKYLRAGTIPMKRARQITEIRGCRKQLKDFLPYID